MPGENSKRLRRRGGEHEALLEQLKDERGKRVVFVSHCLLNENVRYLGGTFRRSGVEEVIMDSTNNGATKTTDSGREASAAVVNDATRAKVGAHTRASGGQAR
jgi:hypothetical protein